MITTETFNKKLDGKIYARRIKTEQDINGKVFTVKDTEQEIHPKTLLRLNQALEEVDTELTELQKQKAIYVNKIAAIETARDS